jgi:flagellin
MSVINTNVKSLVAQQSLTVNERKMTTAMERLSTGNRINSAADDAAGLAISSRMDSQIRGLNMAIRNSNDGISLLQTAEGAMQEVTSMLQRVRELSVQSINGVNNDSDRSALNDEVKQLITEIDRVAKTTQFNNVNLFDGSFGTKKLQIGDKASQSMDIGMADIRSTALGSDSAAALSAHGHKATSAANLVTAGAISTGDLVINGVAVGSTSAVDDTLSMDAKTGSAIAKVAAINRVSDATGVKATVGKTVFEGAAMTAGAAVAANVVTINGVATANFETVVDLGISRDNVVAAINRISSQTGVTAVNTGSDKGGVQLIAADGRNISVVKTTAATSALTGLADAGVQSGTYSLKSSNDSPINISSTSASPSTLAKAGLSSGTFQSNQALFTTKARDVAPVGGPTNANSGVLELGDLSINGISIDAAVGTDDTASNTAHASSTKAASAIAIAAAINKSSAKTGVTAVANENKIVGTGFTAGTDTLAINGVSITAGATGETRAEAATRINNFAGQTGVVASDNGAGLTFTATDGRNITLVGDGIASHGLTGGGVATAETRYAGVTLKSDKAFTIDRGANANTNLSKLGFSAGTFGGDGLGGKLADVSIGTAAAASSAIGVVDSAIGKVNEARSDLGAKQNRLEYTVNNLSTMVTNTSASQSRIRDADYAVETTNLARAQIIQQAATAMLAQANQQPQSVLSLLQ